MQTRLAPEIRDVIGKIPFLPAITIVMPYNPKMDTNKHLYEFIAYIKRKANDLIYDMYEDDLSILVLQKLDKVFKHLNTATPTESVAIFLSPVFEKVLYLNYPVETFIGIDDNFSIHQAVLSRQKVLSYMVLDLTFGNGRLCLGNSKRLMVVKNNSAYYMTDKDTFTQIDTQLKILMEAYDVPVFVTGNQLQLSYYQDNTQNSKYIVKYIPEPKQMSMRSLYSTISLYFKGWENILGQFDMNQVKAAVQKGALSCGIAEVVQSAKHHKPVKLFINEIFASNYNTVKTHTHKQ